MHLNDIFELCSLFINYIIFNELLRHHLNNNPLIDFLFTHKMSLYNIYTCTTNYQLSRLIQRVFSLSFTNDAEEQKNCPYCSK